ncbi:hypothetical protein QA601_13460 [Chitinispirillales bacterium ANBcel5]|uniref:3-oxoacyl-ACP synthase n=1 Tax=Cellulosispirillum alkaliphilum TaxID=3039283 RepID=UPI002A5117DF|nr:hypothetical protein [Chitinispirillales bacterium ANBcel5]
MSIKSELFKYCLEHIEHLIDLNNNALSDAQNAANNETKSTAGDKHETARAMKQLETEAFGKRLVEAMAQYKLLSSIDVTRKYDSVQPGSLALTSIGNFFVAVSADEVVIDGEEYCMISTESPIYQAMQGSTEGSTFSFRGKEIRVTEVL